MLRATNRQIDRYYMDETRKLQIRKKNLIRIVTLAIFVLVLVVCDIALLVHHDKPFSQRENRVLQQAPELTASSLVSGKYMTEVEDFISDQFFLRDGWISYKLGADKLLGKKESNGIYLGKNGYLIEDASGPRQPNFDENLAAIADFADKYSSSAKVMMSVIPNAVSVCSQLLPAGAPVNDQREVIAQIQEGVGDHLEYVDLYDELRSHNNEDIYYKSDHHWTSQGAKYAFEAMKPVLDLEEEDPGYTEYIVTDDFSGTLASSSGAADVKDPISIYVPNSDLEYVVEYVGENMKKATIFDSAALDGGSKYEVFFGGNYPLIKIRTTAENKRNLLVIKDSYANAFMQFLLPYYGTIYMVDPRYYSDDIDNLITTGEITDILFLYNVNTFAEDNSIASVLTDE